MTAHEKDLGMLVQHCPLPASTGMDALEARVILLQEVPPKRELRFFAVRGEVRDLLTASATRALLRDHAPRKYPAEMSEIELWAEISALRTEVDQMRPVYVAAKAWRRTHSGLEQSDRALVTVVDAAIAAEPQ